MNPFEEKGYDMSTTKDVTTRPPTLIEEMMESKGRASNNESEVQIEDLKKVLWLPEAPTTHEETQQIKVGAQSYHDKDEVSRIP